MTVGVWSYYSVDRPPVNFHRVRSPFDAPTDNYSGNIAGLFAGRFRSPETIAGLHSSSLFSVQPQILPCSSNPSFLNASTPRPRPKAVPDPTRVVVTVGSRSSPNIPKTSPFYCLDSLPILFLSTIRFRSEGQGSPFPNPFAINISPKP